jgi:hypothetical protein
MVLPKQADIFRAAFAMDNHWSLPVEMVKSGRGKRDRLTLTL